jgi:hypothetical protein
MGGKGVLNSLPIVPKASIYVPKVMLTPVMGGNTMSETSMHMFLFQIGGEVSKTGPGPRHAPKWLSIGGKGVLNSLPIVPKASIYVPKVMLKPVMGGNTMSETSMHMFLFQIGGEDSKTGPGSQFGA